MGCGAPSKRVEEWGLISFFFFVGGRGGGGIMKHRVRHMGLVGGFFAQGEMVTEYQKGCIGSNFRLHLKIVLFGSWFNLKTYF